MCYQISKALDKKHYLVIKIIMSIRLLLGIYSKIHDSVAFAVVAKTYCFIYTIALIYLYSNYWGSLIRFRIIFTTLLKTATFFLAGMLSILTDGEYLFNYIQDLDKVGPLSLVEVENFQVPISLITFILILSLNIYGYISLIAMQTYDLVLLTSGFLVSLASHTSHMTRILMLEMLWVRVKSLRKTVEHWIVVNNFEERQVRNQIKNLEDYMSVYKNILKSTKIIGHTHKFLMLMALSTCFFNFLILADILSIQGYKIRVDKLLIVDALLKVVPICIPSLFGELVNTEVEKTKNILAKRLRVSSDNALQNKILKAIKYIDMCPIKFTVWRLFSVDFSLLLAVFNLCTTYTIVLLQFKQVKI